MNAPEEGIFLLSENYNMTTEWTDYMLYNGNHIYTPNTKYLKKGYRKPKKKQSEWYTGKLFLE